MALGAALRHRLRPSPPALTAAAGPTAYSGADAIAASRASVGFQNRRAAAWQEDAWAYFDSIGAAKYAGRYVGNSFARLRLVAGVVDEDGDNPTPISAVLDAVDDPDDHDGQNGNTTGLPDDLLRQAQIELGRIRSSVDGQAGINRDIGLNFTVAGDCNLVGIPPTPGTAWPQETWDVYSVTQLVELPRRQDGTRRWALRADGAAQDVELPDGTFVQRLYQPHPKRKELADSPFRGVLDDLEELALLKRAVRSIAKSRVGTSGVFLIPSELEDSLRSALPEQDPNSPSQIITDLVRHMTTPLVDEGSAANVVPHFLSGPAEYLKEVRHVPFLRQLEEVFIKLREEKLRHLAIGLDMPPEVLTGTADVNHWGSAQIAEETYKAHIEPPALLAAAQIAAGVLRPLLAAPGTWSQAQLDRIVVMVDGSRLVARPDKAADALNLHGVYALSDEALRRYSDFTEDDAPSGEEIADRVERERLIHARGATPEQLPPGDVDPGSPNAPNDGEVPVVTGPPSAATAPGPSTVPAPRTAALVAVGRTRPIGQRLTALDLALQARVQGAAQQAVRRAVERIGTRIMGKAAKDRKPIVVEPARDVPKAMVAATLGPAVVASLGVDDRAALTEDLTGLADQVDADVQQTRQRARRMLIGWLAEHGREPSTAQLAELDQVEQRNQARGREVLVNSLTGWAQRLLYQLDAEPDTAGEGVPAGEVPTGLIRTALAAYGGQDVIEAGDGYRVDQQDQPAGVAVGGTWGVAAGNALLDFGAGQGMVVEGWTWNHGAPAVPFPPHEALDGQTFGGDAAADAAALSVGSGWDPSGTGGYSISDHPGCTCWAEPALIYVGDSTG